MKSKLQYIHILLALFACIHQAAAQNLLVGDSTGITQVTPGGVKSPFAPGLTSVGGMTFDGAGNLFAVSNGISIVKITPNGTQSIFVSSFTNNISAGLGLAFDSATNLYVANYASAGSIIKITPNGTQTVFADHTSGLVFPLCLAFNSVSNLFVANKYGSPGAILEFNPSGTVNIFAQASQVSRPCGVAFDSKGNLFVSSDFVNCIYEIMTNGSISTFVPGLNSPEELAFDNAGNLYEADLDSGKIYEFTNNAGTLSANPTLFASGFNNPSVLVFQPVQVIPFSYTTNNGTITITGYTGSGGAVIIPGTINGYPVTSIGADAFFGLTGVTSANIPNSVTNIGADSFNDCGLTSVNLSSNVNSIGSSAFSTCLNLTNITVDAANSNYESINGSLFDKSQTTLIQYPIGLANGSYSIPNGVASIGAYAFESCFAVRNLTIPNTVASIGAYAFASCTGLSSVTIPNNVANLGNYAFAQCTSLTNITFLGNAPTPTNDTSVFQSDVRAPIAYYLQGATGWGTTFDGIPTSIILPPPPALGISTYSGQPAVFFPTATGTNYVLQMTTNLANGPWVTVTNGVPINGLIITNPPGTAFFRLH